MSLPVLRGVTDKTSNRLSEEREPSRGLPLGVSGPERLRAAPVYPQPPGNARELRRGRRCARLKYGTGSVELLNAG